ncbi:MAG: OmpA family protein [Balneolales bacterium]|nr:OmpA family protein [Balneolales bacterium]
MKKLLPFYKALMPKAYLAIFPLLILLVGCGGPPANNPLLLSATSEFNTAQQDTMVVRHAPVALKEAEEALEKTQDLWESKADKAVVDHYAFIAQQRTLIAIETAKLNAANSELSRSEVERQQVLLDVRRSESERSEARARQAQREAQSERALAADAMRRAEELAQQVRDLEARPTERGLVLTLGDVLFETGKSDIRSEGMRSIENLATFLNEYPERNIMIEGFTDNVGSESFNMQLSRDRANSVKSALVSRRIQANRIETVGFGLNHPVADNTSNAGRQQNRRVEIIISDQDGKVSPRTQ